MTAPILWIWDDKGELIYEGQLSGKPIKAGLAYRYKLLCQDGVKSGLVLAKHELPDALILDDREFELEGELHVKPQ